MRLIINADDFGFSRGTNYGIIDAHRNGVVRSTSIMAGMPGFNHAVELLKECPKLGCGVHLTLSAYKPILGSHKTIVDKDGFFYRGINPDKNVERFSLDEIYNEFCAQIEKVKSRGIEITHLDSHHHVHTFEFLKPVIERLLEKYDFPIRGGLRYKLNYDKIVLFEESFYDKSVCLETFKTLESKSNKYDVLEIMSHPAYIDSFIMETSSYNIKRAEELKILTSNELKEFIDSIGIELCNYRDIF